MSALARTDGLYAFGLAVWSAWCAAAGTERPRAHAGALVVLELGLGLCAVLGVVELARDRVAEAATFGGYLCAAVVILPAAAAGAPDRSSRWDSAVLALACVALAVVAGRLVALAGG